MGAFVERPEERLTGRSRRRPGLKQRIAIAHNRAECPFLND
jgi:hypothetical protein